MLSQLKAIFDTNFKAQYLEVGKIENSCCTVINEKAFHFDYIIQKFFQKINVGNFLRSVDIIHFSCSKGELMLAELTSYKSHCAKITNPTDKDCLEYVRKELICNDYRNKFIHTIFTILKIADYYNLGNSFYSYFFDTTKLKIKNYLVMDLTSEQYIFIEISCLDKLETHKKNRIEGEMGVLNCEEFQKRLVA